jgi:hypothetical protein
MMKTYCSILLSASLLGLLIVRAGEAAVTVETASVNAGGGRSEGGVIVLHGTLGQAVAGVATGGDIMLESGFWTGRLEVVVDLDNAFREWMDNLDTEDRPPAGQRGASDTPAGDGVSNLLKFAFGLKPMEPAANAMPTLLVGQDNFLGLSFVRSADAQVTLKIYGSEDLENWQEIPHTEIIIRPGLLGNREKVRLMTELKAEDHDQYFFRLQVEVD